MVGGIRRLALVAPILVVGTVALFAFSGITPRHFLAAPDDRASNRGVVAETPAPSGEGATDFGDNAQTSAREATSRLQPVAGFLRFLALGLSAAGAALAGCRWHARATRRMQRIRITPGRSSEASPAQVAGLIESIGKVTRQRWWVRLLRGTPPVAALEFVSGPHPSGTQEQRIGIAVPLADGHIAALQGVLSSRYPDVTLAPVDQAEGTALRRWLRAVVRLKKARTFTNPIARPGERSLESIDEYGEAPLDMVLSVMAETGERVLVQITVTPTPNFFQRSARTLSMRDGSNRDRPLPGAVRTREERAATEAVAFRPLSFCEVRVGAESYAVAERVAGAIEGIAEGGENHLRQRRPVLRRALYARRMERAESNPIPSFLRGVYSSVEIAALWNLPTPYGKNVAITRNNVPQLPAPPEVWKLPDRNKAIATDLKGTFIGIRPGDYRYGVQVSGMAGGGKTSILAKIAEARAREPNTSLIILDPKGELSEAAASLIPSWRVVRFLDFARPLFGMTLRTADRNLQAEAAIFSEAMVDVSRTEEGDSQALNASQRSFKMARQATLALEDDPTFWHTARWLASDDDAAAWRAEKIARLAGSPTWHPVWDHFARILPAQLKKSPSQAVMRLEAPYNKIQTLLGDERLNTVLHHPVGVSFDSIISKREVLIIAARTPVHPDGVVLLKFFLQLIHRAILGQQPLPEDERANVAVLIDDAGEILNPTVARMMEHDRSAGLDMALGWQHGGQVSKELAPAIDGLCNSRIYLRSSEEDARGAVNRLNPAYDERQTAGFSELRRRRVEVNQLTSLEKHHGIAVVQAGPALSNSFTVKTIPWERDPARLEAIEERMREEGAYEPEVIAPPQELTGRGQNTSVDDVGGTGAAQPSERVDVEHRGEDDQAGERSQRRDGSAPASSDREDEQAGAEGGGDPARSRGVRRGKREAEIAELGTPTDKPLSDAYLEVEDMRDRAASIKWEDVPSEPPEIRHNALNAEQRSILEALYELRVLSAGQIQREFLMAHSERQARRELALLLRQRMVSRFELGLRGGRGRGKRVYVLDSAGFEILKEASDHPAIGKWRAPELRSAQHVVHDLARNEWLWALRSLAPRQIRGWRGPRSGKIEVPLIKEGREAARRLTPTDLRENAPVDFDGSAFGNIIPDLAVELELPHPTSGEIIRTDLLLEIEWGNNDETVKRKALEYDAFLTGWWRAHPRYGEVIRRPPIVFFAVPDARRARRFIELLDETLKCHLVGPAETQTRAQRDEGFKPTPGKMFLGRRNIFVVVARDVHQRTLRAWRVLPQPPEERIHQAPNAGERRKAARPLPRSFMLIKPQDQVDPAR